MSVAQLNKKFRIIQSVMNIAPDFALNFISRAGLSNKARFEALLAKSKTVTDKSPELEDLDQEAGHLLLSFVTALGIKVPAKGHSQYHSLNEDFCKLVILSSDILAHPDQDPKDFLRLYHSLNIAISKLKAESVKPVDSKSPGLEPKPATKRAASAPESGQSGNATGNPKPSATFATASMRLFTYDVKRTGTTVSTFESIQTKVSGYLEFITEAINTELERLPEAVKKQYYLSETKSFTMASLAEGIKKDPSEVIVALHLKYSEMSKLSVAILSNNPDVIVTTINSLRAEVFYASPKNSLFDSPHSPDKRIFEEIHQETLTLVEAHLHQNKPEPL